MRPDNKQSLDKFRLDVSKDLCHSTKKIVFDKAMRQPKAKESVLARIDLVYNERVKAKPERN
jgi:hypothetical protein